MKVLLVDNDDSARQLCSLICENIFQETVIVEQSNAKAAVEYLKETDELPELIIFEWDLYGGDAAKLVTYLDEVRLDCSLLFYSERNLDQIYMVSELLERSLKYVYLQKSIEVGNDSRELEKVIREISLPKYFLKDRSELDDKFRKVRISYFWRYNTALCDIFLRLSPFKYVKIINKEDQYDKELIDKYVKKNQKFLYISMSDFETFSAKLGSYPFLSFVDPENLPDDPNKIEDQARMTHAVLQDLLGSVGITSNAVKMADLYVNLVNKMAKNKSNLSQLLLKMRAKKNYLYDHSYMLSCVTAFICRELQWHTAQTIEKLCLAALFHDITLADPDLAMLSHKDDPHKKGYEEEEIEAFHSHPQKAADLVRQAKEFPMDVDTIILQHHELPNGSGFPRGVTAEMTSPLICVFIVAHDFISQLYACDFDESNYDDIIRKLTKKYNFGNYRGVLEAFNKTAGSALDM